jgi:calcineurin-like phosphoesterase family protein
MSNVYVIADTHLKHDKMQTYCDRPSNFTEMIHRNIMNTVKPEDLLIHLGDVGIGKYEAWEWMVQMWPCKKTLIIGNHDENHSPTWWLDHGFDSVCDAMIFRGVWITHRPSSFLPEGCMLNLHGHLHNIWHGFHATAKPGSVEERASREKRLINNWQRLFAVEYTNYMPIEWTKFFAQAARFQATGPLRGK